MDLPVTKLRKLLREIQPGLKPMKTPIFRQCLQAAATVSRRHCSTAGAKRSKLHLRKRSAITPRHLILSRLFRSRLLGNNKMLGLVNPAGDSNRHHHCNE